MIGRLCVALVCCGPLACQAPATSESACPGGDDPGVTARSSPDGLPLADGASLPVLITAQGGLVTELDIAISGVAQPDFDTLVVDIYDEHSAPATLAIVVETSDDTVEAQWSIVLRGAQ